MAKSKQKAMEDKLWSLKGKCDGITEVNRNLIQQYCRFLIMADDTSKNIEASLKAGELEKMDALMKTHEKLIKTILSLYKTLKLDKVENDDIDPDNEYLALMQEDETEDDL